MPTNISAERALAQNLRNVLDQKGWSARECSRRTMDPTVSPKTITNMLNEVGSATLDKIDSVARTFGLRSWHLLTPNLFTDETNGDRVVQLVDSYAASTESGRRHIERVAEREAEYTVSVGKGGGREDGDHGPGNVSGMRQPGQHKGKGLPEVRRD